ncbi:hypothetical protein [Pseudalkalibacillus berkeleyi]|uniref:Regulatory protein YycH domain-containing protein n=1 Tax=Pseudalkalibacillus berkeleyi TaxID=1069813 RepID=A0ABS9GX56_9BACL|nr:hypothetical protein [Pseudalkalibacillus berkeleyi]MCF6137274.1 hypothetical protein [Pseudalkalibacillus berkeleyi]
MKGKQTLKKIIPVLLILIAFVFISEKFKEKERTTFAVNREKFVVVDTEKQLKERLANELRYFEPQMFELLEKHDLISKIESVNIPVVEAQREFRIESLYNRGLSLIITYSLDVLPNDEIPDDIPHFEFDRLKVTADGEEPLELSMGSQERYQDYQWKSEGVVYKNRIYRRAVFEHDQNREILKTLSKWVNSKDKENLYHIDQAIMKISNIELQEASLVKQNSSNEKFQLENIAIDYKMKSHDPLLESFSINKSANLGDGKTITYSDIEFRLHQKRLYFELNTPVEFNKVHYKYGKMQGQSSIQQDTDGRRFISVYQNPVFDTDDTTISLLSGSYPTNEEIKFTITKGDFQKFREKIAQDENVYEINRDLGNVNSMDFELVKLERNPHGPNQNNYGFFIKVDPKHEYESHLYFQHYKRYTEIIEEHPEAEIHMRNEPFIDVTDQDGNTIQSDHNYSDDSGQFFGIEQHSFENIEELNIRLFNLPVFVEFSDNHVSLKTE